MLQRALNEGAIEPGGAAGGFVYFKKIRRGEQILTLHGDIIDQASGERRGNGKTSVRRALANVDPRLAAVSGPPRPAVLFCSRRVAAAR